MKYSSGDAVKIIKIINSCKDLSQIQSINTWLNKIKFMEYDLDELSPENHHNKDIRIISDLLFKKTRGVK